MKLELNNHPDMLVLVSAAHPLYDPPPTDLVPALPAYPAVLLRRPAAVALQSALAAIGSGDEIVPVSGYRSAAEQTEIYNASLREHGEEYTRSFVALPFCSEHQTGLAIDLAYNKPDIDFICPDFPEDGICGRFRQIAAQYGFILRYPAGKQGVTGIAHEPWHFRYIGCPHAALVQQSGLTLEEYSAGRKQHDAE